MLGSSVSAALSLGTKAHTSQPGGLTADGIRKQLEASLNALGVDRLEEFYLHQPDPDSDLLESLRCTDALVREGIVRRVGMSNYHASEVARAFMLCDEHGLTKPSVYQGLFNPLNRLVEDDLLPTLREHQSATVLKLAADELCGCGTAGSNAAILSRLGHQAHYVCALQASDRGSCTGRGTECV